MKTNILVTYKQLSNRPTFNLAWEEYILKNLYDGQPIFLLWTNEPSVIVGRNQNVYQEVDQKYLNHKNIPILRRNSGGGTVYHDLGNINYTFITDSKGKTSKYDLMTKPIINALNQMGINAYFRPNSDIYIADKKIGGNAQYLHKNILLHHGTILFNTNLNILKNSLKQPNHISSISVKSRLSNVVNVSNFINLTIEEFISNLYEIITPNLVTKQLTDTDLFKIDLLEKEKYLTDEWNYFESPKSTLKIEQNNFLIEISIVKGYIDNCVIKYQDVNLTEIEQTLLNKPFTVKALLFLKNINLTLFNLLF